MNMTATQEESRLVLIVEDDRFMRIELRYMMEGEGYEVAEASDGEEGLAAYTRLNPDIILLDAIMPVMDGFTCCLKLRSLSSGSRIPILMITGFEDRESVELAFKVGATDYVTKPIDWAVLRQRVRRLLEASRAIEELRQQTERERLLGAIAQHIRQSLNLEEILNTTASEVRQFLQTDRVLIYRFESDWSGVVMVESVDERWTPMLGTTVANSHFTKSCIQPNEQSRLQAVENIYTASLEQDDIDLLSQFQVKANLMVPILQGKKLWGLLIAHHCCQPRQWQQWEIDLLKQLAAQVEIAIQQSQLYKQTQHQALREQALSRVIQTIRNSLDLTTIFSTAAFEIGKFLAADRADILQYLPERQVWLNVADYRQNPDLPNTLGAEIPDEGNEIATRLKQFQVVRIDNASTCADEINRSIAQAFPGAWLLVPLHFGSSIWGSLSLVRNKPQSSWQDSEVEIACAVVDQLAIAIQQSTLFQQFQQLNTNLERQVEERTAQLRQALDFEATLKRITDKVRDCLDESQILQTAVKELALVMGISSCDTGLYNLEQGTSTICYQYTVLLPSSQGRRVNMAEWHEIYSVLLQGQHLQFCPLHPTPSQSVGLACPIFDDQGVLGDLWLFSQEESGFSEVEIRLVQQVANQCAIAIRQARLYQAVQAQVEELEQLNQLKDDFLNTVSHELKTPLSNIKMGIQMLEMLVEQQVGEPANIKNSNPAFQSAAYYFELLNEACDREINLINDLLDIQRINAGTQPLETRLIDLQYWIPYVMEPFEHQVQNHQQILEVDIAADLPPIISDPFSLERILTELLNNACKYTPSGEKIKVTAYAKSETIQLSVSNSGVQIPADDLSRIFDKFYRIPGTDMWNRGGTGLGLALVQKLVAYLGGSIQVESKLDKTCFLVELPINS